MTLLPPQETQAASSPDAQTLNAELSAMLDYVRSCTLRIGKGEIMELSGLDRTIAQLCQQIVTLPVAQAQTLQSRMRQLVEALDVLAARMREQQAVYQDEGKGQPL